MGSGRGKVVLLERDVSQVVGGPEACFLFFGSPHDARKRGRCGFVVPFLIGGTTPVVPVAYVFGVVHVALGVELFRLFKLPFTV